jgi:hypothetical protein
MLSARKNGKLRSSDWSSVCIRQHTSAAERSNEPSAAVKQEIKAVKQRSSIVVQ